MKGNLTFLTIIVAILVLVNAYFFITFIRNPVDAGTGPIFNTAEAYIAPLSQVNYLPVLDPSNSDPSLDAKSAVIYDINAGRNLYEKNIKEKLPIASLTKILNAIVVWEKFSPTAPVTVKLTAVKVDGERQDLYENEVLTVSSLVQLMLIESSNDAAYALRDYAANQGIDLIKEMNAKAADLGMANTHILDAAGLNDAGYSTAADLVKAVQYALRYDAIWGFSRQPTAQVISADGKFSHEIKSTNQLLGVISDIIGGKTGYTDSALGCIILIVDVPSTAASKNDKIISVVLGSHDRFQDMKKLVTWAKQAYRWQF
jgi:D-alanyl-D-alanine carboxypeptidase (penicillin-binding protein 5/6)